MTAQLALSFAPPRRTPRSPCRTSFFKTTPISGADLAEAVARAQHQNEAVLAVFTATRHALSPSDVERRLHAHGNNILLGSVRRSVTTLCKAGALTKTNLTAMGPHGAIEHLWMVTA